MDGHVTLAGRHAGGFTDRGARARDGSIESIPEEPFGPSGALRESERAKRILEYKYMRWIDEMFVNMEKERSDGLARKIEKAAKVDRPEHPYCALVVSPSSPMNSSSSAMPSRSHEKKITIATPRLATRSPESGHRDSRERRRRSF